MSLTFFNTLGRKMEEFVPLENGHVRMYTCGPTVYDYAHIGNMRAHLWGRFVNRPTTAGGKKYDKELHGTTTVASACLHSTRLVSLV